MSATTANRIQPATRRNPLRTYQFRVGLLPAPSGADGSGAPTTPTGYVAGVKRVSGLNMTIAASETREGGNALHRYANPDRATWDPITLEQGLAIDNTLESWADAAIGYLRTGTVDPNAPVKRNVFIDVWDPTLPSVSRIRRYLVFNAWVSRFQALPQLDAMANEIALLNVELTHEGWRRDTDPIFDNAPAEA